MNISKRKFASASLVFGLALIANDAAARLSYDVGTTEDGDNFIVVAGRFDADDDLSVFRSKVLSNHALSVSFDSGGGNVYKAMEFGRLIRSLGLNTVAVRDLVCASACSLSFLGGINRFAEPGSIGVHKSSFDDTRGMNVEDAVAAIQVQTADVISYMTEMGVDPSLLQLALKYDSNDIRYLSSSEMTQFRVTTMSLQEVQDFEVESSSNEPPVANANKTLAPSKKPSLPQIPVARNGLIQDDQGSVSLKASRDIRSRTIATFANGSGLEIVGRNGDWYQVLIGDKAGYLRRTSVWVREFDENKYGKQYIEIATYKNFETARSFVQNSKTPLAIHLTSDALFAVTVRGVYGKNIYSQLFQRLRKSKEIPKGAFVTYGNTYVREVCCDAYVSNR